MSDIEELISQVEVKPIKDYREFTIKSKMRLAIFVILWIMSYLTCTISLFFWNWFILPAISFIILFLLIYFIALDCYKIKFRYVLLVLFWIFLFETISFIILLGFSRYLLAELVLFNVAIWTLLFLLDWQLDHRTDFSPLSYFTQWWFFIVSLLTIFFCVFMMWKYTQIPFTCDDIEKFPTKIAETTANPFKNTRNKIVSRFKEDEEEPLTFYPRLCRFMKRSVVEPFADFMSRNKWYLILIFILLYRLSDDYKGLMSNVFYVDMGFTKAQIGYISKIYGMLATIFGGIIGGIVVGRKGLRYCLFLACVLQGATNLVYIGQYFAGNNIYMLSATICADNLAGGMATTALVAYLSSLCSVAYTATQYALLSSLMSLGRDVISSTSGYVAEYLSWPFFFLFASALVLPALGLLWYMIKNKLISD